MQCRRHEFNPCIRKIPWERKWQSTPIFLPGKSHGQRSLVGYSPQGRQRIRHDLAINNIYKISTPKLPEVATNWKSPWDLLAEGTQIHISEIYLYPMSKGFLFRVLPNTGFTVQIAKEDTNQE